MIIINFTIMITYILITIMDMTMSMVTAMGKEKRIMKKEEMLVWVVFHDDNDNDKNDDNIHIDYNDGYDSDVHDSVYGDSNGNEKTMIKIYL